MLPRHANRRPSTHSFPSQRREVLIGTLTVGQGTAWGYQIAAASLGAGPSEGSACSERSNKASPELMPRWSAGLEFHW